MSSYLVCKNRGKGQVFAFLVVILNLFKCIVLKKMTDMIYSKWGHLNDLSHFEIPLAKEK